MKGYDYSQNGAYFVTFCVKDRYELLGEVVVGSGFHARPSVKLTNLGLEVHKTINFICDNDKKVEIPQYVIMPNHVHLIVVLNTIEQDKADAVGHGNPTLHGWQKCSFKIFINPVSWNTHE